MKEHLKPDWQEKLDHAIILSIGAASAIFGGVVGAASARRLGYGDSHDWLAAAGIIVGVACASSAVYCIGWIVYHACKRSIKTPWKK
jgi:hypothetical protein